jgi:hypothetical protein
MCKGYWSVTSEHRGGMYEWFGGLLRGGVRR